METMSIDLHCAMMRQLTAMFAKMGDLRGGVDVVRQPLQPVTTTITMRRRRRRMTMAVRSWEEKEGEGECKNQIQCLSNITKLLAINSCYSTQMARI